MWSLRPWHKLGPSTVSTRPSRAESGFGPPGYSARIKDYFSKLGRNPTDVELETLAQTWSEHCIHKTFKSRIRFWAAGMQCSHQGLFLKARPQSHRCGA